MMKKLIYLTLLSLNGLASYSQTSGKDVFYYEKPFDKNVVKIYDIPGINGSGLSLNADAGTSRMSSVIFHPNKPRTSFVHLEGASKIRLTFLISKDSIKYYRYSIIQDDTVYLAKDLMPKQIASKSEYYGIEFKSHNVANKKLSLLIYEAGKKERGREFIIYTKKLNAVELVDVRLEEVFNDERVNKLTKNGKGDTLSIERAISQWWNLNVNGGLVPLNANYSFAKITIKSIDNIFLYRVSIKRTQGGDTEVTEIDDLNWKFNLMGNLNCKLDAKNFEKPGKYEIIICPIGGKGDLSKVKSVTKVNFKMERSEKQFFIVVASAFLALVLAFIIAVFVIKRKNRKKLLLAQQQKSVTQMQLNAVRSQLNPHFMFNALAGIQSLMNKNKTEEANEYLGKFARITRNVLDNRELTSLADEKALLADYLQMEQFRFGFSYQIEVGEELDLENTEIPSMLLQPLVENAVKHGIADYGAQGKVKVCFKQKQNNLILEVNDNGKGFDTLQKYHGLGLQLSKDRIALLNNIYKQNPFSMEINADDKGTTITITLVNWL